LNRFKFVLESRGLANSVQRAWQVATRFGVTADRMEGRLVAYANLVAKYGAGPSLPITARVLARNPQVAKNLIAQGVELCVHGLVHNDLSKLAPEGQTEQILAACAIFRRYGIPFSGFRSPYLKYNQATLEAVAASGFAYDSNLPFLWSRLSSLKSLTPREQDGLERGLRFYNPVRHPEDRSLPRLIGNLVEIPVSLPDDEILLDRMGCPVARLGEVWHEMLAAALARGELLTLQLHPERLTILREVLDGLLSEAASNGRVWMATLGEIARWWQERVHLNLRVEPSGEGRYAVSAPGAIRSEMFVVGGFSMPASRLNLPGAVNSSQRPLIGLHPQVSVDLRLKLKELGYFLEETIDSELCPIYVSPEMGLFEVEMAIAGSRGPLLVQSTWPSPFKSAMAATGDIDCLTLGDFARRFRED
jgi:peptidoglycan/xylan/chitin deacetylase (PgdA/CDA1 family)